MMNLDHFTIYVRHQTQIESDEDKCFAYQRTLDYLESFVHYPCTKQQVRRALREWISQSSRKSLHAQEAEALRLLGHLLVYGHLLDVLNGQVAVTVPTVTENVAEAQPSLWDKCRLNQLTSLFRLIAGYPDCNTS